ncbi:MAG: hypothetical protein PQJ59_09085 [Spirochaetales bacterium]|nr:hypothetical protein [Spirochaetales bacterium]
MDKLPLGVQFAGYLTAILIMTGITSFIPLWGNLVFAVLFPILVLLTKKMVPFEKIKLSTLLIGRILTILTAVSLLPSRWLILVIAGLMYVNVAEATISDLIKKRWMNVISGIAILATTHILFSSVWTVVVETGSLTHIGYYIVRDPRFIFWVLAYTLWNYDFVIGEFSSSVSLYHLAVLSTPLILSLAFGNAGLWLVFRATSLTTGGALQIMFKESLETGLESSGFTKFIEKIKSGPVQFLLMVSVIILSVLSVIA